MLTIALLICSNIFMTFAWYGHLKFPNAPLWQVVLISWGIALFEYCLAVPANRIGAQTYSLAQLKTIQEVLSLATFVVVAWWLFGQKPNAGTLAGFALIAAGAALVFRSGN